MSGESWSRRVAAILTCCVSLTAGAATALAQGTSAASITGVVKDTSGAVLPGVTVEVSSPALIEKVRSTTTDAAGQYRIIELRPGTYKVTFSMPGFATLTRDGLELTSNFTATVDADLKVGEVTETLTVSSASPLVDVTRVTQQKVITSEELNTVPTAKSTLSLIALMPAAAAPPSAQDVGGSRGETSVRMSIHGARQTDQRMLQNGMSFNMLDNPTGRTFYMNPLAAQEVVVEAGSGGSAEYSTGGAQVNIISRDGADQFSGTIFVAGTTHGLQANNLTDDLKAQGLTSVNSVRSIYDVNAVLGGPIMQHKLWFTTAHRRNGRRNRIANLYHDANLSDYTFTPDLTHPAEAPEDLRSDGVRLTWAANSRQKFWFSYDWQKNDSLNQTGELDSGTLAIEAAERANAYCNEVKVIQGGWTNPISDRLLLDAGVSAMNNYYSIGFDDMGCGGNASNIRIVEQSTGFTYNGIINRRQNIAAPLIMRGSASYVTGRHTFKAGFDMLMTRRYWDYRERGATTLPVSYRFNNGVPNRLTEYTTPLLNPAFVRPSLGIFAQDQWNVQRLTLSLGLRYEYLRAYAGEIDQPTGFPNATSVHYDRVDCLPCWHDINPRVGVAYDLLGNGKTAVKAGVGRYVESLNTGYATSFGPGAGVVLSTNRTWSDSDSDFFPDCDLKNTGRNGECGPMDNASFGQIALNTVPEAGFMNGFGKRQYNWQASAGVDHELRPGMAISATYYRRWFGNFTVTDNTLVSPSDYDPYCITAPSDARLGSIAGSQICGLYDINPTKFGQVANVVGLASKFGNPTEVYNGFDLNFAARFGKGGRVSGGWNIGNTFVSGAAGGTTFSKTDNCFVVDSPQQLYNCKSENPYQSRIRFNGWYPLPWDLQVAATFQSLPAANYGASYTVSNAAIQPSLGRALAGGTNNVTIDLLPQGAAYLDNRITQLDLRLTKMLRLGARKLQANVDLFNVFNSSTVLQVNSTYGPNWLMPTQILDARLLKFSVQIDF
jgi:Carboxypeptidase regulatory-like domain